ncbi:MAG: anaerobic sulfatase-maturation protein [Bacteroidaceae bacterium]|nr:anaerobic sulfatase-maturation protein [Bacteroidaceae bacterium]
MDNPFERPLYVMLKPVGAQCNLRCDYCYYLGTRELYADAPRQLLSEELLEEFTRQYIDAQLTDEVLFTWHGGEPLLRPLAFYEKAVELQQRYARGKRICNCLQTNGTLLTPEWARFLRDHRWLVGVSIDGPQEFHDEFRRTRQGNPSWARVRKGIDLLDKYQVEWNAMAVVNDFNADYPLDFYCFFRDELGTRFLQFTPIVEWDADRHPLSFSVRPEQWGTFLCAVYDEWVRHDVGEMFVQLFDATLANWCGLAPGLCTMARECGHAAVMEWNGDVYACDHFVGTNHLLGNIRQQSLTALMYGERQLAFGRQKHEALHPDCTTCPWHFACHGECPKNRRPDGRNYLCAGYRAFFEHAAPTMDRMKYFVTHGREARDVMTEQNGN